MSHLDGDRVPFQTRIQGEASNLPKDKQLWLLVQNGSENDYYPQPNPPTVGADGQWTGIASFGHNTASDFKGNYSLHVVLAEPSVSREFENFIKSWSNDQPRGLSLPKTGLFQLASVQLSRSIPDVRLFEPKAGSRVVQTEVLRGSYANLDPDLWQLYGVSSVSDRQFRPFGPAQFETAEPEGWWTLEVEFDWPPEPDQSVSFYMLAILANGARPQQILERAARENALLTYEDLGDHGDYIFDPQGEPLAKTSFQRSERIAFASDRAGNDDIYVAEFNADGTQISRTNLTGKLNTFTDTEPSWSPDGKQLAFAANTLDNQEKYYLYLMDAANGANFRPLLSDEYTRTGRSPSWSPDGQWIAFDSDGQIYKVEPDSGEAPVQLTTLEGWHKEPVWSPDGREILYRSGREGVNDDEGELFIIDAETGDQEQFLQVTKNSTSEGKGAWSPDGRYLLVPIDIEGDQKLHILDLDDRQQLPVASGTPVTPEHDYDWSGSFAPDGRRFVYDSASDNRQLLVGMLPAAPQDAVKLNTGLPRSYLPAWSPTDDRIAFVGRTDGDWDIYSIWAGDTSSQPLTVTATTDSHEIQPRLSPDGWQLAFASNINGDYDIWLMNIRQPDPWTFLKSNSSLQDWQPAWSPDGNRLAFASERAGDFNIYVSNLDGTGLITVTDTKSDETQPSWANDTEILFSRRNGDNAGIYQVNIENLTETAVFTEPGRNFYPALSPNGKTLLFASDRDSGSDYATELYVLDMASGKITRLTNNGQQDTTPLWSENGQSIYFTSTQELGYKKIWSKTDINSPAENLLRAIDEGDLRYRDNFLGAP